MIEHLKQLYDNHLITNPSKIDIPEQYVWYQTDEGPVGILKTALSEREQSLLDGFLNPYAANVDLNRQETIWYNLLFRKKTDPAVFGEHQTPFRLIHFHVKDPTIDAASFSEAVGGLFPSDTVILWETSHQGVLITSETVIMDDAIAYKDLIDTITSDFYTDFLLYIGSKQTTLQNAAQRFRHEQSCFQLCKSHFPAENVFRHEEQVPFLLLYDLTKSVRTDLFDDLLQDATKDQELLHSIREYLACNMNVTTAAKKLFIHRNSLQYRVDKFIEKTGLDVKDFSQAVTVYLALLEKQISDEKHSKKTLSS